MANRLSYRIVALSLALLVLLTSTGFSMDVHYCQNQFVGVSFLGKSSCCSKMQETAPCHQTKEACHVEDDNFSEENKMNCCHSETVQIEKADVDATADQATAFKSISQDFVVAFVAAYVLKTTHQIVLQPFEQYEPPLPDRDVQVLYQTFLI